MPLPSPTPSPKPPVCVYLIQDQQDYLRKFTHELITDYDSSLSDRDDLNKENDQQGKTIHHLQTRIKLLDKSQNEIFKTHGQLERENKTLKGQLEERLNELKTIRAERRKEKTGGENKLKAKINELEQQFVRDIRRSSRNSSNDSRLDQ